MVYGISQTSGNRAYTHAGCDGKCFIFAWFTSNAVGITMEAYTGMNSQ